MSTAAPLTAPDRTEAPTDRDEHKHDRPWKVIVWDDPVTLMDYVVFVLRKLFGHDEATATTLMLKVHHEGKAVVAHGPREKAEMDVHRLHAHGLQATLARDE
jgi:ATP-dependent Clp protease adaptor protein ClpS